jgi:Rrf2 family protein
MLLNQTAEYAFRAMAYLASRPDLQVAVPSAELAEAANIPSHYVSKVMRRLVVAGLVTSQRGHGGGFRLAVDPAMITFSAILKATDLDPRNQRCAFGFGQCDVKNPCHLHPAWSRLKESFNSWAESTTLDSVHDNPEPWKG